MTKPFEYAGRTYTFERSRGSVKPIRDDGCTMFGTYPSFRWDTNADKFVPACHAHLPAFATIQEAQAAIMDKPQPTFVHMPVWAHDADEAARIREDMDNG